MADFDAVREGVMWAYGLAAQHAEPVSESWFCLGCRTTLDSRDEGRPCWKCGRKEWK